MKSPPLPLPFLSRRGNMSFKKAWEQTSVTQQPLSHIFFTLARPTIFELWILLILPFWEFVSDLHIERRAVKIRFLQKGLPRPLFSNFPFPPVPRIPTYFRTEIYYTPLGHASKGTGGSGWRKTRLIHVGKLWLQSAHFWTIILGFKQALKTFISTLSMPHFKSFERSCKWWRKSGAHYAGKRYSSSH